MAVQRGPTFFPSRINMRVASMQAVGAVLPFPGADLRVEFLAPAAPVAAGISVSQSATGSSALTLVAATASKTDTNAPFGRNIRTTVVTAATYVSTATILGVSGLDYLNNVMTENISLASATADAALVEGAKAFAQVNALVPSGASAAGTHIISVGFGNKLGLPYRNVGIVGTKTYKRPRGATSGDSWDAVATATGQTIVGLGATIAPSASGADVRGTYSPTASCDGTADFAVEYQIDEVNAHGATQA